VVFVDGQRTDKTVSGGPEQTIQIASGLSAGEHTITIWKNWGYGKERGPLVFHGFVLQDGHNLVELDPPAIKMEIYGNSITEGTSTGGYAAYPAVAARELGGSVSNCGVSGIALMNGTGYWWGGGVEKIWDKYDFRGLSATPYDFTSYIPDIVIFALGVNDQTKDGFNDFTKWKNTYKTLIDNIKEKYGDPVILFYPPTCPRGPADLIYPGKVKELFDEMVA